MEGRAAFRVILAPDAALVGLDDFPANRQAQPRSAGARSGFARLNELVEDRFQFILGKPDAVVTDGYPDFFVRLIDLDPHRFRRRERTWSRC